MLRVAAVTLLLAAPSALAATAQIFSPPSVSPTTASGNYTGASNGTIQNGPVVVGKSFDRFVQIWLENTDFATASSSAVFQNLAKQGVLFDGYYGVTHPSQPNYIAAASGSFHGLNGDSFVALPSNVSTIVDLLEAKNISWSSYQENMPYDGYGGFNFTSPNYINASAAPYTYYVRKHNPLIIHNSVANVSSRALRIRNFNDLAADVNASAMSQWSFITPNLVNDAHDTNVDFTSDWLTSFLVPLLANPSFNDNRTVILLTFDESESYNLNNNVYTLALGGGLPKELVGTTDSTYYTHYSTLSTVQANWGLGSLGRGDTNKTLANVFSWVANATGYKNNQLSSKALDALPLTNITGTIPGPLNTQYWVPVVAPDVNAVGAGGGAVFVAPGTNLNLTQASAPAPVNLTAFGIINPESINPGFDYSNGTKVVVSPPAVAGSTAVGSAGNGTVAASVSAAIRENVVPAFALVAGIISLVL